MAADGPGVARLRRLLAGSWGLGVGWGAVCFEPPPQAARGPAGWEPRVLTARCRSQLMKPDPPRSPGLAQAVGAGQEEEEAVSLTPSRGWVSCQGPAGCLIFLRSVLSPSPTPPATADAETEAQGGERPGRSPTARSGGDGASTTSDLSDPQAPFLTTALWTDKVTCPGPQNLFLMEMSVSVVSKRGPSRPPAGVPLCSPPGGLKVLPTSPPQAAAGGRNPGWETTGLY